MGKLSPNQYFKSMSFLYVSLIFAQLIFIVIVLFLRFENYARPEPKNLEFLKFIVPLFAGFGLYESNVLFKKQLKKARKKTTLARKLENYRAALIVRFSLWEAPSLFAIVAYFLTGEWLYLALSGLMILVFLANRPTMYKARRDLEI